MGINVNESMEFLIKTIVSRLEEHTKHNIIIEKDKKHIVLDNKTAKNKKAGQKNKDSCC